MTKKVFCGGLPWEAGDDDLRNALTEFGPVADAKVILDRETKRSRGFGFVTFVDDDGAAAALQAGTINIGGRDVRINEANDQGRGRGRG